MNPFSQIPFRLRYALALGLFLGIIISTILVQLPSLLTPSSTLPNSIDSTMLPQSAKQTNLNISLPFITLGQHLDMNISFITLSTTSYFLSIGMYEILVDNATTVQQIALIGPLITWNITDSSSVLGKVFSFQYTFPHNGKYFLMFAASKEDASIHWTSILSLSSSSAETIAFLWVLLCLFGSLVIFCIPSLVTDLSLAIKSFAQKSLPVPNHKNIDKNVAELLSFLDSTKIPITDPARINVFPSYVRTFILLIYLPLKRSILFLFITIFITVGFTIGFVLPTVLYQESLYQPITNAGLNILLAAPVIRVLVLLLAIVNTLSVFELWNDRETGFTETILAFPFAIRLYYLGKFFFQLIIDIVLSGIFFFPMLVSEWITSPLRPPSIIECMYFVIAVLVLVWIITGLQFILLLIFRNEAAVACYMVLILGWVMTSILLASF